MCGVMVLLTLNFVHKYGLKTSATQACGIYNVAQSI